LTGRIEALNVIGTKASPAIGGDRRTEAIMAETDAAGARVGKKSDVGMSVEKLAYRVVEAAYALAISRPPIPADRFRRHQGPEGREPNPDQAE
jgi:hypothetical protein